MIGWILACARPDPPEETVNTGIADPLACAWTGQVQIGPETCPVWHVDQDLFVDAASIAAGTVVEAAAGVVITLTRTVSASGTPAQPVVFRSQGTGRWGGLALDHVANEGTYTSDDAHGQEPGTAEFFLTNVQIREAGAGTEAALTVTGSFTSCGYAYDCVVFHSTLHADGLSIHGADGIGIAGDGWIDAITPIGLEDIGGQLLRVDQDNLDQDLVIDLGGNLVPAIGVLTTGFARRAPWESTWASQTVPLQVDDWIHVPYARFYYSEGPNQITIEPNTVLFGAAGGVLFEGGVLQATGVTFARRDPAAAWAGFRMTEPVRASSLELDGCVIDGPVTPAIDWALGHDAPSIASTTIQRVEAEPGADVCVVTCADLDEPSLANTLDCTEPVRCPP